MSDVFTYKLLINKSGMHFSKMCSQYIYWAINEMHYKRMGRDTDKKELLSFMP